MLGNDKMAIRKAMAIIARDTFNLGKHLAQRMLTYYQSGIVSQVLQSLDKGRFTGSGLTNYLQRELKQS